MNMLCSGKKEIYSYIFLSCRDYHRPEKSVLVKEVRYYIDIKLGNAVTRKMP